MKKYKLPTRKQCLDLLKQYHVPEHIVKHSITAAKLAVFLAQRLEEKSIAVDIELVDRACLLHDIARPCDFGGADCNSSSSGRPVSTWRRAEAGRSLTDLKAGLYSRFPARAIKSMCEYSLKMWEIGECPGGS